MHANVRIIVLPTCSNVLKSVALIQNAPVHVIEEILFALMHVPVMPVNNFNKKEQL